MAALFGSILMLLLFAVLFILILGINLLARFVGGINNLWNIITGQGVSSDNRNRGRNGYTYQQKQSHQSSTSSTDQGHRPHSKGVFGDDEGTYVDFEEVK